VKKKTWQIARSFFLPVVEPDCATAVALLVAHISLPSYARNGGMRCQRPPCIALM
jgi:hypothetical protein